MRRLLSACVRMASLATLSLVAAAAAADAIDDYIHAEMANQRLPGLALAVVRGDQEPILRAYGVANVTTKEPMTPATVFRIGAVSKQFIAAGIMLLVADHKVQLDDSVTKFLADAPPSWKPITVENLLTHTSGLPREAPGFDPHVEKPVIEVIRSAYAAPLVSQPSLQFQAGGLDYFVLAEIITRVSGKPWATFLHDRLFTPLQMSATDAVGAFDSTPNRATGYVYRDNLLSEAPAATPSTRPSAGLISSLSDLVKWDKALQGNRPLHKDARTLMWTSAKLPSGNPTGYGFGWWTDDFAGHPRVRHGGESPGLRVEYARFPKDDLSVIVLVNGESARADAIAIEVASRFIDGLGFGRKTTSLDAATLQKYAGRFEVTPDNVLTIAVDGDGLSVQSSAGGAQYKLTAESPGTFFISQEETYQFTVWHGVAVELSIRSGVQELKAHRVQ